MRRGELPRAPRIARAALRLLIWGPAYEAIAGDLEEELATEAGRRLGAWRARLWYLRQALFSVLAYYRLDLTSARTQPQGDDVMLQDLGYGLRMLRKNFGFTAAAVVTLALGIGANTAIFSLIHTFLVKPLPYEDASRVSFVLGWNAVEEHMKFNLRLADYADLERQSTSFSGVAAYRYKSANLTGGDVPERVQAYETTVNVFGLLRVEPHLGRTFAAEESAPGHRVAVLSHRLWQSRFGGDENVVGHDVTLDGEGYTVIGVMPRGFEFPIFNFKGDLWVPLTDDLQQALADRRGFGSIVAVARLRDGVSVDSAQAEVDMLMERLAADHPETNTGVGARVMPMQELLAGVLRPALLLLFAAVTLVLLMACANVANLLLARALTRGRELAVRTALGAGASRLVRQLLTESLLLSALGGVLGLGVSWAVLRAVRAALPELIVSSVAGLDDMGLNGPTLAFAFAASIVTGVLFGLVPALRAARSDVQTHLKEGSQGSGLGGRHRLRQALVTGEVALSLLLLVTTGLLVQSFRNMLSVDTGFDADRVLTLSVSLPSGRYAEAEQRLAFYDGVTRNIEALPGVESVGLVNTLPFSTANNGMRFVVEGRPDPEPGAAPRADYRIVNPEYLSALRIEVLQGRGLEDGDRAETPRVALVNQTLAERHFPDENPIGRRFRGTRADGPWYEIVGVVGDVRHWQLTREASPEIYLALAQRPTLNMSFAVRTSGPPEDMAALVRRELLRVDPLQPVFHVKTLRNMVAESHLAESGALVMMSVFAVVALVLAALGLYGVIAYAVSQSTREIGIRMALGARSGNVLGQVLREGIVLVAVGAALGLAGAWGLTRFLSSLLYGIAPHDPASFALAVPLLALVSILACLLPARRAARVDPVVALRGD